MQKHNETLRNVHVDQSWTLFLDRDGVINDRRLYDYVKEWNEFHFLDGVKSALAQLTQKFGRIIVVTNQQGVGKGFMTKEELESIHSQMLQAVKQVGGRIDAVYCAVAVVENDVEQLRKPHIGMALRAQEDFPKIEFKKSIMVGDAVSDMQFGKNAGMVTVFVGDFSELSEEEKRFVDYFCESLSAFATAIC